MLRMYLLQQWYGLADEALEDAIYDNQALRDFVGIDLSRESVPNAATPLKFRRLLVTNDLTRALFEERVQRRTPARRASHAVRLACIPRTPSVEGPRQAVRRFTC